MCDPVRWEEKALEVKSFVSNVIIMTNRRPNNYWDYKSLYHIQATDYGLKGTSGTSWVLCKE